MELAEYAQMEQQEQNYWWHIGRRKVLQQVLWKRIPQGQNLDILDVGCGTGINYHWLKSWGRVVGLDPSPEALSYCRTKQVYDDLIQADGADLPYHQQFDLITAFDVLEHIPDDRLALQSWFATLKPNGSVYLTVPAYQWLFSAHDKALHHQRRYSTRELSQKLKQVGFKIKFISPFFWFTFPLVVLVRLLTKASPPKTSYVATSSGLSQLLVKLSSLEANFLSAKHQLPYGSSIVVLATKP